MFADLIRRLTLPTADPLPDPEARVALAALMVRVARSDGHYAAPEVACIDTLLAVRHGLTRQQAAAIRADAEVLESEAPDTVRFTRAIKDAVALEDRGEVVEALWAVALADGERDAHEDGVLRLVANLLGINDRDSALARQRAAARRSDG
jgi:uncharacterized tellurite resistance protein B-like protein